MTNRSTSPVNTMNSATSPELRAYNNFRNSHVSIITSPKHSVSMGLNSPAQISSNNANINSANTATPGGHATNKDKKRISQKFRQ
ncbi:hypothetical protein K6H09_002465 [Candida tropicalis]